jgi:hypothetical protein
VAVSICRPETRQRATGVGPLNMVSVRSTYSIACSTGSVDVATTCHLASAHTAGIGSPLHRSEEAERRPLLSGHTQSRRWGRLRMRMTETNSFVAG